MESKKRILIVDDEPEITLLFNMALDGFMVDSFNDPLLALSKFKQDFYDLAILDVVMPKMNGFELYKEIKKIDGKVRVCFLTELSDSQNHEEFRKVSRGEQEEEEEVYNNNIIEKDLFIQKPVQNKEIINHINKILNS
jgi:CheY-like chemotaxis protein